MQKVKALVPMKHHSQRVPGKNYRPAGGKPLYHHILDCLQAVTFVEEIIVDTDSPVLKKGLAEHFPEIRVLDRPPRLCGDEISMNKIIAYDLSRVEGETFLQTHATNPLLSPQTVTRAIKTYLDQSPPYDSLFSVTPLYTRLWDQNGQAINHDPQQLIQTQDLPPVYEENSCLYIFSKTSFSKNDHRLGETPLMFEIDAEEAWDIDTELDFDIAVQLMEREGGRS